MHRSGSNGHVQDIRGPLVGLLSLLVLVFLDDSRIIKSWASRKVLLTRISNCRLSQLFVPAFKDLAGAFSNMTEGSEV